MSAPSSAIRRALRDALERGLLEAEPRPRTPRDIHIVDEGGRLTALDEDGMPMGALTYRRSDHPSPSLRALLSEVRPEHRGRGVGPALYDALLQKARDADLPLLSDGSVSADARRMYARFAADGTPVIQNRLRQLPGAMFADSYGPRERGAPAYIIPRADDERPWQDILRDHQPDAGTLGEWLVEHPGLVRGAGAAALGGATIGALASLPRSRADERPALRSSLERSP